MKLLRPTMPMLRTSMRMIDHGRADSLNVVRLRGEALMAMRKRIFARCGQRCECEMCQATIPLKLTWNTFELDHIVALFEGGTNQMSNLRALHIDCHKRVTQEQQSRIAGRTWADAVKE